MAVLVALEHGGGPMTLTQIGAEAQMQPSKAHRYLVSLCRMGLVSQAPSSGLYDLGPALRRLGAEALRRMDEVGLASEYVAGLCARTKHGVGLYVWGENGPILVRWDTGGYLLPMTIRVGTTVPLATTSAGRVFLAHLPPTLTEPVLQAARKAGLYEVDAEEIERIKTEVRRDGLSVTSNALIPGVSAIAAPVFTTQASLPLAVVVLIPARQATAAGLRTASAELLKTTAAISAELGAGAHP